MLFLSNSMKRRILVIMFMGKKFNYVTFEVCTASTMENVVLWDDSVALVRTEEPYGVTSQKTAFLSSLIILIYSTLRKPHIKDVQH
jgi:hypothetical protein